MNISTLLNKKEEICPRCKNYGYYSIGVRGRSETVFMFCTCEIGKNLRTLSMEWRVNDIKAMANNILPRIDAIKAKLHEPEKASIFLDELKKEIKELIERSEKALKEVNKA